MSTAGTLRPSAGASAAGPGAAPSRESARTLARRHGPLGALLVAAALLRLTTLGRQSLWYDEAFTPVHVLHPGLGATLRGVVHTENSPPLWYVLEWAWTRLAGTGAFALRLPSALAGIGLVAVAWAIGREVGGRRTAVALGAIVAFNPLFFWYSQEARDYALFALAAGVSLLFFLRAWRTGGARDIGAWGAASVVALLTHYFAAFLVGPEALLLAAAAVAPVRLRGRLGAIVGTPADPARRALALAVGAVLVCGLALIPLISAQGGHGTQWIGRWALGSRLVAIPGYFLLGGQSSAFGHGLLVLCLLPILLCAGLVAGLERSEARAAVLLGGLGAISILVPLALIAVGADYLAPRNLIASWVPLAAALAVVIGGRRAGRAGAVLLAVICVAGLGVILAIDTTPRYQRGDWSGVASALKAPLSGTGASRPPSGTLTPAVAAVPGRAIVTVELGSAPLEFYAPGLRPLPVGASVSVREVDFVGYAPLRAGYRRPPAPGFALAARTSSHGLVVLRWVAPTAQVLDQRLLRRRSITATRSETLVGSATPIVVRPGG